MYALGNHGGHPTEYIGDSFGTSNIEAPTAFKLYEAYFQQIIDDHFTFIFGLRDLNVDYYSTESAGGLLNSSFGISPSFSQTGVNGPSIFPSTALALMFKYESPHSFYFQSGIFNATAGDPAHSSGTHITKDTSNGYLYVWETGFSGGENESRYKYGVGAWAYSKAADATDTSQPSGQNSGLYFLLDCNLSKEISVFLKHGLASAKYNQFSSSTEIGITYLGLLQSRPEDILSFGLAQAEVSDDYKVTNGSKSTESVVELSYRMHLNRGISITPDWQYVKNPGVAQDVEDAQVATVRFEIEF